jgi:multiple sugar transport system permease protein
MGSLSGRIPIATVAPPRARPRVDITPRGLPPQVRRRRFLLRVANHSVALTLAIVFLMPFVFVLLTALMSRQQALSTRYWPHPFVWSNFLHISDLMPILRDGWNSTVYAVLSSIGVVVSSVPVAYALSRMRWRGRQIVFILVLSTLMLPDQVTSVPLYVIFVRFHWIGTLKPLIVPNFLGDAFSIFLLRQFFMTIPEELADAARVDGAGDFRILTRVVIPLAKPALAAVALFQFLYAWNDFYYPLLYAGNNPKTVTLAVGLSQLLSSVYVHFGVPWNILMAGSVIFMTPVIVIFFLAQRAFIEGVTLTGIKG